MSVDRGVFRTTDGGRSWVEEDHKLPVHGSGIFYAASVLAIDPRAPATVYAAGEWGVYRSINGGQSWYPIVGGLPTYALAGFTTSRSLLVLDPVQPGKLYAGTLVGGIYTYTVQ